jgi:hypothetical protein
MSDWGTHTTGFRIDTPSARGRHTYKASPRGRGVEIFGDPRFPRTARQLSFWSNGFKKRGSSWLNVA